MLILLFVGGGNGFAQETKEQEPKGLRPLPKTPEPKPKNVELTPEEKRLLAMQKSSRLRDMFAFRVGLFAGSLLGSEQDRPGVYPYLGARLKTEDFYLDVHMPSMFGVFDGLVYLTQRDVFGSFDPTSLFQTLNKPIHYAFLEVARARIGKTFPVTLFSSKTDPGIPLRIAAGGSIVADVAVFDLALLGSAEIEDPANIDLNMILNLDPAVLGPGIYGSVGAVIGAVSFDVVLEAGYDLFDLEDYTPAPGWVISVDTDLQIDIIPQLGLFLRPRYSLYTNAPELVHSFMTSMGIVFRL